jgi:hypothetical protein
VAEAPAMTETQRLKDLRAQAQKDKIEIRALREAIRPRLMAPENASFWDGICLLFEKKAA